MHFNVWLYKYISEIKEDNQGKESESVIEEERELLCCIETGRAGITPSKSIQYSSNKEGVMQSLNQDS